MQESRIRMQGEIDAPLSFQNAAPMTDGQDQEIIERRDIILENDINNQRYCMPSIEVKLKQGAEPSLNFSDLIQRLKEMSFPLSNCMLFCWDQKREMHVFVANDPMLHPHYLPLQLCGLSGSIYIKFRALQSQFGFSAQMDSSMLKNNNQQNGGACPMVEEDKFNSQNMKKYNQGRGQNQKNQRGRGQSVIHNQVKEEDNMMQQEENIMFSQIENNYGFDGANSVEGGQKVEKKKKKMMGGSNKSNIIDKRVKERYIEQVRQKVSEWRAMHEIGVKDQDGNIQKLNLDYAANCLGISRKTMDDYYLQLRRAEQLGFDFEKNKSEKMGTLRKFVKDESSKPGNRSSSNIQMGDDSDQDCDISSLGDNTSTNASKKAMAINPYDLIQSNNSCRGSSNNLSSSDKSPKSKIMTGLVNQNQYQQFNGNSINPNLLQNNTTGLVTTSFAMNNEGANSLITPYHLSGVSMIGRNSGGFAQSQQFRQSPNQYYFPASGRGSYMTMEQNIDLIQRNSNSLHMNSQIFNPGSQFLGHQQPNSHMTNPSIINGGDMSIGNIMINESLNASKINQEQTRFSNHFSLISFGNNSQFTDERGSINFMSQNPSNVQNISHIEEGQQPKGSSLHPTEDNYITTQVNPQSSSNNNSIIIHQ